jgi:hypothetical protein
MPRAPGSPSQHKAVRVFVSYSHKDAYWLDALMPLLRFPGVSVKPWNDKEIKPGLRWDEEIRRALAEMDVFIPLVSVNFAVSRYIEKVESPIARERHKNGEIEVVPVLVHQPGKDDCAWLMKLQRVPPGDKSWAEVLHDFQQFDMALTPIRDGIRLVLERARERKRGKGL